MEKEAITASVVLAAGRGSRMIDFRGNKTLLPLLPGKTPFDGRYPLLLEILKNLPPGPKALVVHYKREEIMAAIRHMDVTYCIQEQLDGTGGALLAARSFLENTPCDYVIITMGDVPFVRKATYRSLVKKLDCHSLVVLGFRPEHRKQYGLLKIEGDRVTRIIEWKYWNAISEGDREDLTLCNSGIYAAKRDDLLRHASILASKPHWVQKTVKGKITDFREFFITDIVQYMHEGGLSVGYVVARDEDEVMGVDDLAALQRAREIFQKRIR